MKRQLTVCITTCNRAKELKNCLQSLKKNDLTNVTVVIGDNSSNDKSSRIVESIMPDAKYFHNVPQTNEVQNTNKCFSFVETPYVLLLHDDDSIAPTFLKEVKMIIAKFPKFDIAYSGRFVVNQNNTILKKNIVEHKKIYIKFSAKKLLNHFLFGIKINNYDVPIMTPGMIFKTSLYKKTGGLDGTIDTHYDSDFINKTLALSRDVILINKPIYNTMVWDGTSGRTKSSERGVVYDAQVAVIDSFIRFAKKNRLSNYIKTKKRMYDYFSSKCLEFNGPFTWISLRFAGSYWEKNRALTDTYIKLIRLNPKLRFSFKLNLIFILNLAVNKFILKKIQSIVYFLFFKFG